jgi:hypothetical protein
MALALISVRGVDLGKNVCSVVGLDAFGKVAMRRKVRRETLIRLAEKLPPCGRDCRLRQQAGEDRLGGPATRRTIRGQGSTAGGLEVRRSDTKRRSARDVCDRVTTRWPNSRMALWKPGPRNGARRRVFYEDWSARISILAGKTLPETGYVETDLPPISTNPLANVAAHTFFANRNSAPPLPCRRTGAPSSLSELDGGTVV